MWKCFFNWFFDLFINNIIIIKKMKWIFPEIWINENNFWWRLNVMTSEAFPFSFFMVHWNIGTNSRMKIIIKNDYEIEMNTWVERKRIKEFYFPHTFYPFYLYERNRKSHENHRSFFPDLLLSLIKDSSFIFRLLTHITCV